MALTNKGNIKIGSTEFSPQSLKVNYESLSSDESGRTDDGQMHIYWIFNRIRKIEVTLKPDTPANISTILNLVLGKIDLSVTYWDPATNAEKTSTMYCSNGSSEWYSGVLYNGLLQGVTFSLIEIGGSNE